MPLNTNPQAVRFTNTRVRVAADAFSVAYHTARRLLEEAVAAGADDLFASSADVIDDGSGDDGRTPFDGADALAHLALAQEIVTLMEPHATRIAKMSTNGGPRF